MIVYFQKPLKIFRKTLETGISQEQWFFSRVYRFRAILQKRKTHKKKCQ